MKRAFPQKPVSVSQLWIVDSTFGTGQGLSGNPSRFRTSAAMLSLALSVGASSTFFNKSSEAFAAVLPNGALALPSTSQEFSPEADLVNGSVTIYHTVAPGETLWGIAAVHGSNIGQIEAANGISPEQVLQIGQVLRIPLPEEETISPDFASVESGLSAQVGSTAAFQPKEAAEVSRRSSPAVESNLSLPSFTGSAEASEAFSGVGGAVQWASVNEVEDLSQTIESLESLDSAEEADFGGEASTPEVSTLPLFEPSVAPESEQKIHSQAAPAPVSVRVLDRRQSVIASVPQSFEAQQRGSIALTAMPGFSDSRDKLFQAAAPSDVSPPGAAQTYLIPRAPSPEMYEVRPGDTVWTIASSYGFSLEKLLEYNPDLSDPNFIRVGETLRVPTEDVHLNQQAEPVIAKTDGSPEFEEPVHLARIREISERPLDRESLYAWLESIQQDRYASETVNPISDVSASPAPNPRAVGGIQPDGTSDLEQVDSQVSSLLAEVRTIPQQASTEVALAAPAAGLENLSEMRSSLVNPEFSPIPSDISTPLDITSPQLLAAAPLGSEAYLPQPDIPTGQMVSPDLPLLPQPSEFLPEAPNQFDGFIWPTQGVLTSGYGWRWGRMHQGIDIAGPVGTPIVAANSGVVVRSGWNSGGYGNMVDIRHPDGSMTRYAHNSRLLVRTGQEVQRGQQIAEMGSTGYSTGPHLHFEVHMPGSGPVNPIAMLPDR